jgi:hypothetical protein
LEGAFDREEDQMSQGIEKGLLRGRWLHAHEEDGPGRIVFRPDHHPLPPSRGRSGYVFQADGTLLKVGPGPVDRSVAASGTWSLDAGGRLTVRVPGSPEEVLQIESLDADRLVARPAT